MQRSLSVRIAFLILFGAALGVVGCRQQPKGKPQAAVDYSQVVIPAFSTDSAYAYIADQVKMGPRTPGSDAHRRCAAYLISQLQRWCDTVVIQSFTATLWDGTTAQGSNIIGSIGSGNRNRILIAAHWDSRLWADHDSEAARWKQPIPGANDGASGVGVILELARTMSAMPPNVGVDFILFDLEDQGTPEWADAHDSESWCKGSQYWSRNLHQPFYTARYGVLYDMVGSQHPRFTREDVSRQYANGVLNKYWDAAAQMGYGNIFLNLYTDPILDDHYYINTLAHIPTIDIVQNSGTGNFFEHWHTLGDDIDCINPETLGIVGTVTLKALYGDYPATDKRRKEE